MRRILFLIAPLVLLGCSRPAAQTNDHITAASAPVAAAADTGTGPGPGPAALQASDMTLLSAVDDGAEPPSTMLNRYVAALLNRDRWRGTEVLNVAQQTRAVEVWEQLFPKSGRARCASCSSRAR